MYERKTEPLASPVIFYKRVLKNILIVLVFFIGVLALGTLIYHCATKPYTPWLDAFHNASMILSGMGPIITSGFTTAGKIFSSIYALFSGIVFVGAMGFAFAPAVHRIFHKLHLEESEK
jgi:hypothetical protein